MTVKRVVVEPDLGIEADELFSFGDDERIDLEEAHVLGDEGSMKLSDQPCRLLGEIAVEPERLRDPASMVRHNSGRWIDGKRHDLVGTGAGDLLDVHAARCRYHEGNARAFAVDERREIKLPLDGGALLDVEAADLFAVRARLMRDQHCTEQPLGLTAHLLLRFHHLDAAGLAATARMDLRLDDEHRRAEIVRGLDCLFDRKSGDPARHRHAEFSQHRLGLVFVDVHASPRRAPRAPSHRAGDIASARVSRRPSPAP